MEPKQPTKPTKTTKPTKPKEPKAIKAAFSLKDIKFPFLKLDLEYKPNGEDVDIDFKTSGIFLKGQMLFKLTISFYAYDKVVKVREPFIEVKLIADFQFKNVSSLQEIPEYFYRNSIAIVYPYLRSLVSTLSLQSNQGTLILPTMNLSMLGDPLIQNTTEE